MYGGGEEPAASPAPFPGLWCFYVIWLRGFWRMGGLGWHEASPCLVIIREKGALWGSMRDWLERWLLSASDGMLHQFHHTHLSCFC